MVFMSEGGEYSLKNIFNIILLYAEFKRKFVTLHSKGEGIWNFSIRRGYGWERVEKQ